MKRVQLIIFLLLSFLYSCKNNNSGIDVQTREQAFVRAMVDASRQLTTKDVYNELISLKYGESDLTEWKIVDSDTLLLVASMQPKEWTTSNMVTGDTLRTNSSPDMTLWVTIPKEIDETLLSEEVKDDSLTLNNRLIELIGLRPDGKESTINLFWINKNDLLRPSYNPSTTTTCGAIDYPTNEQLPSWYKEWFEANIAYSYESPEQGLNYPFSRLGYTYDWGTGRSKYGLSEFITAPSSALILERRESCWSYYKNIGKF